MIDLNFCLTCLRYSLALAFIPFMFALAWRFAFALAKDLYRKRRESAENADANEFVRYVRYVEYGEREEPTESVEEVKKAENGCGCCLFPFVFFALVVFFAPRLEAAFRANSYGPYLTDYGFWVDAAAILATLFGYLGGCGFAQKFAARRFPTLDEKRRERLAFWLHPLFSFPLAIALSFPFVLGCVVDRAHTLRKAGATPEDLYPQEPPTVPALDVPNADDR